MPLLLIYDFNWLKIQQSLTVIFEVLWTGTNRQLVRSVLCSNKEIQLFFHLIKGTPPTIFRLRNNGICNIRESDCLRTTIQGKDFIDSTNLKIRTTKTKVRIYECFFSS